MVRKYRNVPTVVDGVRFASRKEARRYGELKLLERAGVISNLEVQPKIKLEVAGRRILYRSGRQATYRGDFRYLENGRYVVEDTKGMRTRDYKLKDAILLANGIYVVET
jgi:hypothetical protein